MSAPPRIAVPALPFGTSILAGWRQVTGGVAQGAIRCGKHPAAAARHARVHGGVRACPRVRHPTPQGNVLCRRWLAGDVVSGRSGVAAIASVTKNLRTGSYTGRAVQAA